MFVVSVVRYVGVLIVNVKRKHSVSKSDKIGMSVSRICFDGFTNVDIVSRTELRKNASKYIRSQLQPRHLINIVDD